MLSLSRRLALASLLAVTAAGSSAWAQDKKPLLVAEPTHGIGYLPLYVAINKGFFAEQGIEARDAVDLVTEEFDADRQLFVRRNDLDRVAAHAERTSRERHVVAVVLNVDEQTQERIPRHLHTDVQLNRAIEVRLRCTEAVDARHRCHHDHVPS